MKIGIIGAMEEEIQCIIEEMETSGIFEVSRRKTSQSSERHGSWMESKGYTNFNHLTKKYE